MNKVSDFPAKIRSEVTAVIASAGTVSGAVDMVGTGVVAIQLPAAMTGGSISFQASADNVTFSPVYDDTGLVAVTTAANQYVTLPASITKSARYVKLVSDTAEGAERTIKLIARPVDG